MNGINETKTRIFILFCVVLFPKEICKYFIIYYLQMVTSYIEDITDLLVPATLYFNDGIIDGRLFFDTALETVNGGFVYCCIRIKGVKLVTSPVGGSTVAGHHCLCVGGFICGVCFVIICS